MSCCSHGNASYLACSTEGGLENSYLAATLLVCNEACKLICLRDDYFITQPPPVQEHLTGYRELVVGNEASTQGKSVSLISLELDLDLCTHKRVPSHQLGQHPGLGLINYIPAVRESIFNNQLAFLKGELRFSIS
jgi:hypothetical protein